MSDEVRAALSALMSLRSALLQHSRDGSDVVGAAGRVLQDARQAFAADLARRIADHNEAQRAYQACLAQRKGWCSGLEARVQRTQLRVVAAHRAVLLADEAASAFLPAQRRYSRESERLTADGLSFLSAAAPELESYLDATSHGGGAGATRSGGAGLATAVSSPPLLSATTLPGGTTLVPVDLIDDSDSPVKGPESFTKGYSPEDLRWSFDALHEVVLPGAAHDLALDYFRDRDHRERLTGTRSYAACYDGFFGDSAIHLSAGSDGRYVVANGYHRIWVARQAGVTEVPARVSR